MDITTKRNIMGCVGWALLTLCLTMVVTLPAMFGREYYQSKTGGFPFEWDDVERYMAVIGIAQVVQILTVLFLYIYR